ncbi:hypothetical protein LIER_07328 [Lithospermum erythrorhizon]|uniref:Uncharacterized protein n=1 Tax=Lithospermum erythrorhizon TaxID=34254 RepID=A0AAV3P882_LITER
MADHDRKSHEPKPISRKETFSPDDQYSHRHWTNTHRVNSVEIQSSANFLSTNSAGQISLSSSSSLSNENPASTVATGENLKDYVASTQSSNCVPCRVHVSSRSDVTSETGSLVHRGSSGLDAVKSEGRQKYTTESSCSNSIQITLPVSSSNESYLELSTEMRSAKPHSYDTHTSTTAGFGSTKEEPLTRGTVREIAAQSSMKVVDNGREDIELKVSGLVGKQNVFPISSFHEQSVNGVGQSEQFHGLDHALGTSRNFATGTAEGISLCRAISDSNTMNKECNVPAVNEMFLHFGNSGKSSCLTETQEPVATISRKGEGRVSSYLDIVDQELMKQQPFSNLQHPPKATHSLRLYEPSGLSYGDKSTSVSVKDPDLFDLNENSKEFNSYVQSFCETGNPFNVIRVLAKPGVPLSIPMTSQKLEGEMSWKGSAATSAFRPTKLKIQASQSSCAPTVSKGFTGFDLNVAATEDAESELHLGVGRTSNPLTLDLSSKVRCSKVERIDFDLNCVGDMFQGTALPATSVKTGIVDFKLDEGSSTVDKCDDGHWKNNPSQHVAKVPFNSPGVSFTTNSGAHGLNVVRPAYWSDFSNIQFYSQSQIQPFLMTSANALRPVEQLQKVQLQPKLPCVIPSLPPQSYPPSGPFFVCPNGLVSSNIHYPSHVQYSGDPQVHAAFPQRISHTTGPISMGPHFVQMVHGHGRSQNEVANIRPRTDFANGGISAFNGSPRDTRQYFPPKCPSYEGQMRVPPKRTEPEGGHDALQLRTRQLTSWK